MKIYLLFKIKYLSIYIIIRKIMNNFLMLKGAFCKIWNKNLFKITLIKHNL